MYETNELNKLWLICENQKQNEFQKVVAKLKLELNELSEKNSNYQKELVEKNNELSNLKKEHENQNLILNNNSYNYNEITAKAESLEMEKNYLLGMVEEKNKEIEKLLAFEIENAELKAKTLLESLEPPKKEEPVVLKKPNQHIHSSSMGPEMMQNSEKVTISILAFNNRKSKCWVPNC